MDTRLTIRQICFLFLFLSISSIFNYIPNLTVQNAGGTGYIAVIYGCILLLIYAGLLLLIIRTFPEKNIYEVIKTLFGTWIAKTLILLYAIWAYLYVITKIGAYSVTLQATLMPSIHPGILIVILFLLVVYTLTKNPRTIFRFAEFLYQPVIIFLAIMFIFALPSMDLYQLVPVSVTNLEDNLYSIPDVCSIGGNLVLLLFFCKELIYSGNAKNVRKRIINTVVTFTVISILAIVLSVAINGTTVTAKLSYPIFQAMKSVSVLNTFERFDSLITMIVMMSDFAGIYVFLQVTMLCLGWLFDYKKEESDPLLVGSQKEDKVMNNGLKVYGAVLLFIACAYILLKNVTQYEFEAFYRDFLMYLNLAFQYVIPVIVGIVCLGKQLGRRHREHRIKSEQMQTEL